jgi:hypothetical protein
MSTCSPSSTDVEAKEWTSCVEVSVIASGRGGIFGAAFAFLKRASPTNGKRTRRLSALEPALSRSRYAPEQSRNLLVEYESNLIPFYFQYLGCIQVFESRGMDVCEEALKQLRVSFASKNLFY